MCDRDIFVLRVVSWLVGSLAGLGRSLAYWLLDSLAARSLIADQSTNAPPPRSLPLPSVGSRSVCTVYEVRGAWLVGCI